MPERERRVPTGWLLVAGATLALAALLAAGRSDAADPQEVARRVDQLLAEELSSPEWKLAGPAEEAVFLRRVFLDLIGEPPTPDDVLAYLADRSADKRARLVERLLADPQYGENWASYWRDVILYPRTEERAIVVANSAMQFLTEAFNNNTRWDEIVTQFITARGDVRENGATALIMAQGGKPEEIVAEVSRIFLGIQIQCAQCHDHPSERWKREQFHQLAAFFPRVAVRPDRSGDQPTFLVTVNDGRFAPRRNDVRFVGTPEHYMPDLEDPQARGTLMKPALFVTGQSLPVGVSDAMRRGMLARWLTSPENPWFAKAFVNRMWAELCGEGFYEPIDQMGPDHTPTAPRTLDYLAAQFAESGYDIKWLLRVITATQLYQSEGRARRLPDAPPMTANVVQPLRADVLYESLLAALGIQDPMPRGVPPLGMARARAGRFAFNQVFGFDPSTPREEIVTTLPQVLAMMNSRQIAGAASAGGPLLRRVAFEYPRTEDAVRYLYLRVLSRFPTESELQWATRCIEKAESEQAGREDLLWVLLNSTEFAHRP
ncbi:MAG: hypothetical protein KatS3mg110_2502 [Pirellulaceae bacterium]|nr:MAG: hypothetical protein KatS3mg110_2502 [Pirellulaceae bacterium]